MAMKTFLKSVIQCDKCTAQCTFQADAESYSLMGFSVAAMAHFHERGWDYGPGRCLCPDDNDLLPDAEYLAASELVVNEPM